MKKLDKVMFLLAILVVISFMLVGVTIGYRNYLLAIIFFLLGFGIMGYGMTLKRKRQNPS